jgi:hypothetical protein
MARPIHMASGMVIEKYATVAAIMIRAVFMALFPKNQQAD